jgi:hypothetical protein
MSIADWATTISGFLAVVIAVGAGFRWLIKNYLFELKNNGGGSMKDAIDRISDVLVEIKIDLARLEGKVENHIEENKD